MSAYQQTLQEQLEEGLRSIQHTANTLMHEIASEVWRAGGGDKGTLQSKILESLSRDQSLRSLMAHTDERFQALAVRTSRLEDTMNMLATSIRSAKQQIEHSVERLEGLDAHPILDSAQIRAQLSEVTKQIGVAFETLAERDRAIVESVRTRVQEHGELISQEATRIAKAMESYVQHGVQAMGQLAGSTEARLESIGGGGEIGPRIAEVVEQQSQRLESRLNELAEFVDHLQERVGIQTRDVAQEVGSLRELTTQTLDERIASVVEAKTRGLAQLVRSDSEALRGALVRAAAERDEATARILDERLERVSQTLVDAIGSMVEQMSRRISESAHEQLQEIGRAMAEQSAQALEVAVARGVVVEARMQTAVESMERTTAGLARIHESAEETVARTIDGRLGSLARLIRADNETLAQQIVADQEASKQALRAMKELQASLPGEVIDMVEQRFVSLAESIERSNEMLAARIDLMTEKIGERYDNDIQVVIDRMGDAMHALASLGRGAPGQPPGPRIEID